jgi:tRNA threonylcarbamoyladenosine biosynthesis protein TsaB
MERSAPPAAALDMIALGLDTSTPLASVALLIDDGRVLEREETVTTHSERLLPLIDALFAEAGARPEQLAAIVCAAGPGSFTGLRIGLATAKGLCLATGAALVLVSSLEAICADAPVGALALATIDAYRGEVYAGLFEVDAAGQPRAVDAALAAFATRPEALAAQLGGRTPSHHGGDGFIKHPGAIPAGSTAIARMGTNARALLRLGLARLAIGERTDPRRAAPTYVRPPAPEERRRT